MGDAFQAFAAGALAQSSLLLAGLVACWITVPRRVVGVLAGYGAGALIAAVAFDLVAEASALSNEQFAIWMMIGVGIFLGGDALVERKFGSEGVGGAMGIVVGSVVDGVPESLIFGIQMGRGIPISTSFLAAVFISNIPQAIAPSSDLAASGWSAPRLGKLWLWVVLACGVAALLGFIATDAWTGANGDRAAALAAGGLLAMLTNSLMPFAFERGKSLAGIACALAFCVAVLAA